MFDVVESTDLFDSFVENFLIVFDNRKTTKQYLYWVEDNIVWLGQVLRGEEKFDRERYHSELNKTQLDMSIMILDDPQDFRFLEMCLNGYSNFEADYLHESQHLSGGTDIGLNPFIGFLFVDGNTRGTAIQPFTHAGRIPDGMSDEDFLEAFKYMLKNPDSETYSAGDLYMMGEISLEEFYLRMDI